MARRCPPQAPSKTKDRFHLVSDAPAAWVVAAPAPRAGAAAPRLPGFKARGASTPMPETVERKAQPFEPFADAGAKGSTVRAICRCRSERLNRLSHSPIPGRAGVGATNLSRLARPRRGSGACARGARGLNSPNGSNGSGPNGSNGPGPEWLKRRNSSSGTHLC